MSWEYTTATVRSAKVRGTSTGMVLAIVLHDGAVVRWPLPRGHYGTALDGVCEAVGVERVHQMAGMSVVLGRSTTSRQRSIGVHGRPRFTLRARG